MVFNLTDNLVSSVLPNSLVTVDEEISLADRVRPFAADAVRWLELHVVGDVSLPADIQIMAERVVALRAVMKAVPALDVVATPSGFGVVSSNNLAPASKERVERLLSCLSECLLDMLLNLQEACVSCPEWRASPVGIRFCSSFIPYLRDVVPFAPKDSLFLSYENARLLAVHFESRLAEEYLGYEFLDWLRSGLVDGSLLPADAAVSAVRNAVVGRVARGLKQTGATGNKALEVWLAAEAVVRAVRLDTAMSEMWLQKLLDKFDTKPFRNFKKGGYFF